VLEHDRRLAERVLAARDRVDPELAELRLLARGRVDRAEDRVDRAVAGERADGLLAVGRAHRDRCGDRRGGLRAWRVAGPVEDKHSCVDQVTDLLAEVRAVAPAAYTAWVARQKRLIAHADAFARRQRARQSPGS
jgi:hypothetical protein